MIRLAERSLLICLLLVAVSCLLMGCASIFPNMAEAIAPEGASLEEAGIGLLADIELWIETVGGWIAFLIGA